MVEKFLLAIVITFALSCLQGLSIPVATQLKAPTQHQFIPNQLISFLIDQS